MKYFSEADVIAIVEIVKGKDSVRVARECVERAIYDYLMEQKKCHEN